VPTKSDNRGSARRVRCRDYPHDRPGADCRRRRAGVLEGHAGGVSATREQRCWFHVSSNVRAALPTSAHPGAKAALAEVYNAEDRDHVLQAVKAFDANYGAKWPRQS
jgi:hypothetical protein